MERFNTVLREVMTVSKGDLQKLLAEDKRQKAGKPKPGPKARTSVSAPADSARS
jgi:hypothetical protein